MNQEQLLKLKKSKLQEICKDLEIETTSDQMKPDLVSLIVASPLWTNHPEFVIDEDQENEDAGTEATETNDVEQIAALTEECVAREITLNGDETIEELKALITKDDDYKIEAAEKHSAIEKAKANGVEYPEDATAAEILVLITEKQAEDGRLADISAEQERQLKEGIQKNGVTLDYINKLNSHLIDCVEQMARQQEREKKSSDRFYQASLALKRMRADIFIR